MCGSSLEMYGSRLQVAASKNVRMWLTKVRKIKSIYHTLNLFNLDVTQKCLIAECWCPVADLDRIQLALKRGTVGPSSRFFLSYFSDLRNYLRELITKSIVRKRCFYWDKDRYSSLLYLYSMSR
ncbi:unnamed protein product [Toxocara canis]|uniref:V-type proton ATPase subunit a n=1 Tax=Toxocara canis TaxID=6265 RepID=A0A183U8Q2_TOXCA|nr:unnamed protein product [Toxocara canis]